MKKWQLQEAKSKLSELVKDASTKGPQEITVRGKGAVIVLSSREYEEFTSPKSSLVDFLNKSPLKGLDLETKRDKSEFRDLDL